MDLEEAIQLGFADDSGCLRKTPAIEPDGRAIVPYGVRSLGKRCIGHSSMEYLLLPDTLEVMADEAIELPHVKGVAIYSDSDDPRDMEIVEGVCDLHCVRRFEIFTDMKSTPSTRPIFDEVIISAGAEIKRTYGCDGPIKVVGDGTANVSVDGVLYTDGGETLTLFPPTRDSVKKFVVPETVKKIAPYAFHDASIDTVVLTSNIEEVCPKAFDCQFGIKNVIIHSDANAFLHENVRDFYGEVSHRKGAFTDCWHLKSATFGDGISAIAENMFTDCWDLSEISLPDSLIAIEEGAFERCEKLSLVIPETVKSIAPGAFYGTRSVILPSTCESAFEEHLAASKGTVVAVAGADDAGCVRAGYTPPKENLTCVIAAELSSGIAFDVIDARFHDGGIKKFKDRIRVAITRLVDSKCGHAIDGAMKDEYAAYVKKNAKKAAKTFDEEGDVVCIRLLEQLGYDSAELVQKAKANVAKPKKPSVAQLTAVAVEAMRKGDASGLDALALVADRVNPVEAVRLLKYGAINGDAEVIERLYTTFGKFEMPNIALCYAIAFGNDDNARTLMEHGVTLGMPMDSVLLKGDTASKRANRQRRYLDDVLCEDGHNIPGRKFADRSDDTPLNPGYIYQCALSSKSDGLVSAYAKEGLLCPKDLKGLMLACLAESSKSEYMCGKPKPKLARLLAKCGGLNGECVTLHVQRGPQNHHADICDIEDLLYPGCSTVVAKAVCSIVPERISGMWDRRYLNRDPEVVRVFVPHLDPKSFKNTGALLNLLAQSGFDSEIKIVCKWDVEITEKMMQKAIESAASAGKASTAALLMDLKGSMFEGAPANSLEL